MAHGVVPQPLMPSRRAGWMLAVILAFVITLTQQEWVGAASLYDESLRPVRDMMHEAILRNRLPDSVSAWSDMGANGLNMRLLTVWTAEGVHRLSGLTVQQSYLWIDTVALLGCCLLLYAFLESITGPGFALAGLLYWGSVLPLTYVNHNFHPWDKPSIAFWLGALILTRRRLWWPLAGVLLVGMLTKYDMAVFPVLIFLVSRENTSLRSNAARTGLFLALTAGTFLFLRWLAPGGLEPRPVLPQFVANLWGIRETLFAYPPLLALGLPVLLALTGYAASDHFAKACVQFAVIIAAILFLKTNFIEFRAEVPLLLLLLPAAWHGFRRLTTPGETLAVKS